MPYRLGFIGAGTIAHLHAETAAKLGVEIAGVCDIIEDRARSMAAEHGTDVATTDADELLAVKEMDAVVVATPNHVHMDYAIRAMRAGKHVLLEKPMALNADQCDQIIAAQKETGQLLQLGFVCRCAPQTEVVKRYIDAGRFGKIYHAKASWIRRRGVPGLGGWFTTKAQSGGGVLIDLGVHMVDLIMHLAGRPRARRVTGVCSSTFGAPIDKYVFTEMFAGPPRPDGVFDVEDAAMGMIRFDGGLTVDLNLTWAANVPEEMLPSGILIMGEKGGCFFDLWGEKLMIATEQEGRLVDVKPHLEPGDRWLQGWQREHELFAQIVTGRRKPTATGEHGREVQAILDAMYRSSAEGREVEVG